MENDIQVIPKIQDLLKAARGADSIPCHTKTFIAPTTRSPMVPGNGILQQELPKEQVVDALSIVEDEVRELVRRRGLDPAQQPAKIRSLIEDVVRDYDERALLGAVPSLGSLEVAQQSVFDNVAGFGALQPLLDDPTVEEIWINAPSRSAKVLLV